MIRCAGTLVGLMLVCGSAHAAPDLGDLLIDRATDFGNEVGVTLGAMTAHLVDMTFDVRHLAAHVRLGGGGDGFGVHFDGRGVYHDEALGGAFRVNATLELDLGGACHRLALPAVDMTPVDLFGRADVIVRVPVFERSF